MRHGRQRRGVVRELARGPLEAPILRVELAEDALDHALLPHGRGRRRAVSGVPLGNLRSLHRGPAHLLRPLLVEVVGVAVGHRGDGGPRRPLRPLLGRVHDGGYLAGVGLRPGAEGGRRGHQLRGLLRELRERHQRVVGAGGIRVPAEARLRGEQGGLVPSLERGDRARRPVLGQRLQLRQAAPRALVVVVGGARPD